MIKSSVIAASIALASLGAVVSTPASAAHYAVHSVHIQVAPPAPRYEAAPAPRRGHVWVPGHWEWRGQRHVWVAGRHIQQRPGHHYRPVQWQQHNGHWQMQRGGWARGDQDRDGIANRHDRDRDGDGVPNRFDQRPDNPYRR